MGAPKGIRKKTTERAEKLFPIILKHIQNGITLYRALEIVKLQRTQYYDIMPKDKQKILLSESMAGKGRSQERIYAFDSELNEIY